MMKNFNPPPLGLNTNTNEAQTQLTTRLQEMLDKCVPEKIIKNQKEHKTFGSMIHFGNNVQLSKIEKEHGGNIGNNTTGRHTQWKETDTIANSTTLSSSH